LATRRTPRPTLASTPASAGDATPAATPAAAGPRVRLGDQLYARIFERIASGALNVGDRLPSELEICRQFGVSRAVVREALLRLRADGLITAHQGLGSFVSHQPAPRIRTLSGAQDIAAYLRCQEVRVCVEGDAARLAALRRSTAQMERIEAAHARFTASLEAGRTDDQRDDLAFHSSIAQACGNALYAQILDSVHESVTGFMRLTLGLTRTGSRQRARQVLDEHAAVVAAIREKDAERARIAMQYHLTQARQRLVDRNRDA
jgi:GntR family transcriptional repressor for pyruvate dehydrogenase complex